jgi:hypothetical protein
MFYNKVSFDYSSKKAFSINSQEIHALMQREYPLVITLVSHIGGPIVACFGCYMPISAASDLVCVYLIDQV